MYSSKASVKAILLVECRRVTDPHSVRTMGFCIQTKFLMKRGVENPGVENPGVENASYQFTCPPIAGEGPLVRLEEGEGEAIPS